MVALPSELQTAPEHGDQPTGPRRYVYCIIDCDEPIRFGPIGIGSDSEVFAIPYQGIAAVISGTSTERFEISRQNTVAHQRAMEAVMERGHTVLPVRFDTIVEDKPDGSADAESRIVSQVLAKRQEEFSNLLARFRSCEELGIKGLWTDMNAVFAEIVKENDEIGLLRERMLADSSDWAVARLPGGMPPRARLGEMVKKALDAKKLALQAKLMGCLAGTITDWRENRTYGDPMFANVALLVEKARQEDFEAALTRFEADQAGQVRLKCVGPVPPSNFIEVVITWDD